MSAHMYARSPGTLHTEGQDPPRSFLSFAVSQDMATYDVRYCLSLIKIKALNKVELLNMGSK